MIINWQSDKNVTKDGKLTSAELDVSYQRKTRRSLLFVNAVRIVRNEEDMDIVEQIDELLSKLRKS